jgi:hypothetical protein
MTVFTKKFYLILLSLYCGWLLAIWLWEYTPYVLCFDDAFYYFEIARNVAQGYGFTFDRINPTNGFHPLWLLICIPVYWFGFDGLTAVRILLSGQIILWLCVCLIMGHIINIIISQSQPEIDPSAYASRSKNAFRTIWVLFAMLAASPLFLRTFVNGLESAAYALCYTFLLFQSIIRQSRFLSDTSPRWRILVGGIGMLCFLSRTDAVLLLICLGICCLLEAVSLGFKSLGRLAELFILPVAAVVLFILFNYNTFGSPWQVSGEIKRIPLTLSRTGVLAVGLLLSGIIGRLFKNWGKLPTQHASRFNLPAKKNKTNFPCLRQFINRTWWFAVFCCLIIVYYTIMQVFPQLWYFGPLVLYVFLIFLCAVIDIFNTARKDDLRYQPHKSSLIKVKLVISAPLALCVIAMNSSVVDPRFLSMCITNQKAGEWISKNLSPNAILGSWDAGVIGYFTSQKIINIDGVVNSIVYANALKHGTAGELLKKQGIAYLVNHGLIENGEDKELKQLADKLFGSGTANYLRLEKSWPFTFRGSSNRFGQGIWYMAVFLYKIET